MRLVVKKEFFFVITIICLLYSILNWIDVFKMIGNLTGPAFQNALIAIFINFVLFELPLYCIIYYLLKNWKEDEE